MNCPMVRFSRRRVVLAFILACIYAPSGFAATESLLHQFINIRRGAYPQSGLISDAQGNLYGTTVNGGIYGFGTVFEMSRNSSGGWNQSVLYSFTGFSDGAYPAGNLVLDNAGNLYGATTNGGNLSCITGCGVIFELSPNSNGVWSEKVLHSFTSTGGDGAFPNGALVLDSSGNLYGTANEGGLNTTACGETCGTVFELAPSGGVWSETNLYQFAGAQDGANPAAGLVFDSQGNLYGTTAGDYVQSTVFELTPSSAGWKLTTLYTFTDLDKPNGVTLDGKGHIFSTSWNGGSYGYGDVFELTFNQGIWTESVIYNFRPGRNGDGGTPRAAVILDASGNLYGTTQTGGANSYGTVFELSPSPGTWKESILYSFKSGTDGANPWGSLLLAPNGDFLGTTQQGSQANFGTAFDLTGSGGVYTEKPIYTFPATDGDYISAGLVADNAGNLYGVAQQGGLNLCPNGGFAYAGCGVVFELSRSSSGGWHETIIHSFTDPYKQIVGGCAPAANLIFDGQGNLYGSTSGCASGVDEGGTVFELSPTSGGSWAYKTLYRFNTQPNDGYVPLGSLVFDAQGNLYGTTSAGGTGSSQNCSPCGTVFKLTPANGKWTESVIYNFQGLHDGSKPLAGLVIDLAGNLYGTTETGGTGACGVVFELSLSNGSWSQTALHEFTCGADGGAPVASLIFDSSGNLYGTTTSGGTGVCFFGIGCGVVFELSPASGGWTENVIYNFQGTPSDGYAPAAGLTFDGAGNLYGTTSAGGIATSPCPIIGCGTVFVLTPSAGAWTEAILHDFTGAVSDGQQPTSDVILDSKGNIYGTTTEGGVNGNQAFNGGVIFQITP